MMQSPSAPWNNAVRTQIRGSGLLLSGNCISLGLNFLTQLLIARYLSTTSYGAWGYALSVVAACGGVVRLGLVEASSRLVSVYHEHHDYAKLLGTAVLGFSLMAAGGLAFVIAFYAFPGLLLASAKDATTARNILLIVVFLVPLEAADGLLMGMFASFACPQAVLVRRHLLAPTMKLVIASLLVAREADINFLGAGYVFTSAFGFILYSFLLIRQFSKQNIHLVKLRDLSFPVRELFRFALPGFAAELVGAVSQSLPILTLGYFSRLDAVAMYRVVVPAALMNSMVMTAFTLMYTPAASRLYARGNWKDIAELYWRTAAWVALLSYPVFAATFCFPHLLTRFLYGARYAAAAPILTVLAAGYYFNAVLGFNGLTLRVLGKIRYLVGTSLIVAALGVVMNLLLIPRYGALGAAVATSGTVALHNVAKQIGLRLFAGVSILERRYVSLYATIAASTVLLWAAARLHPPTIYGAATLIAIASLLLILLLRNYLKITESFPEALKVPLLGRLLT